MRCVRSPPTQDLSNPSVRRMRPIWGLRYRSLSAISSRARSASSSRMPAPPDRAATEEEPLIEHSRRSHAGVAASIGSRTVPNGRQRQPYVRAAAVAICRAGASAVGLGDDSHDRKPEAGSAPRSRGVRACEALESVREEVGVEAVALVEHVELDAAGALVSAEDDCSPTVAQRVRDYVGEGLLEPGRIGF